MYSQTRNSTVRVPSPDFSTLSADELDRLELVLQRQVHIEHEQNQRLAGLRRTMVHLQQEQQRTSPIHSNQLIISASESMQCYICSTLIEISSDSFSVSPPIFCMDCHRPICRRCGNYTSPEFFQYGTHGENQSHSSKWRCRICIVRREVRRKSGR